MDREAKGVIEYVILNKNRDISSLSPKRSKEEGSCEPLKSYLKQTALGGLITCVKGIGSSR